MRLCGKNSFVFNEFKMYRSEWLLCALSVTMLSALLYLLVFIFFNIDVLAGDLMRHETGEDIVFYLRGSTQKDLKLLEMLGFKELALSPGNGEFSGSLNNFRFIIIKKAILLIRGIDMWDDLTDSVIGFILVFRVFFALLVIVFVYSGYSVIKNSVIFRLNKREKYMEMLRYIGMPPRNVKKIYLSAYTGINVLAQTAGGLLGYFAILLFSDNLKRILGVGFRINILNLVIALFDFLFIQISLMIALKKYDEN